MSDKVNNIQVQSINSKVYASWDKIFDSVNQFSEISPDIDNQGGTWNKVLYSKSSIPVGMRFLKITFEKLECSVETPQVGKVEITGQGDSISDDIDDFTKIQRKSNNLAIDTSNPSDFDGDASRLKRISVTREYVIYQLTSDIQSFIVTTYHNSAESIVHFKFYLSEDGEQFYEIERQEFGTGSWQLMVNGVWSGSGIADMLANVFFFDANVDTAKTYQYRVRFYSGDSYTDYSYSGAIGVSAQARCGYTHRNYVIPTGEWGVIGTPDDIRYTYMFGIDFFAINQQRFSDESIAYWLNATLEEFERYLGITIRRRRFITQPIDTLIRKKFWSENCDYTDEDNPYPFDPDVWRDGYGSVRLLHFPIIKMSRAKLYTETDAELLDLLENKWIRLDKKSGILNFFPKTGIETVGPFMHGSVYFRTFYRRAYPHGFKFDYDAGYENSDRVPEELREIIMKWATVKVLAAVGDGLLAGFSSSSISLDGLSESFSSTQSATSAYFGARLLAYTKEVSEFLKLHRYKYACPPIAFI